MITLRQIRKAPFDISLLERAALAVCRHQRVDGHITIVLTGDTQLRALNREHLHVDAPTDVLSFPASETDPETGETYLGDILLSLSRAKQQANAAGHSIAEECQLLVVHGVLHLLGHDHAHARQKKKMWKAQGKILEILDLGHVTIREE
ncbi:MAG: Endoribonuclease YbeY [Anaerolineales bacterium]|nr:Endoribonuclease YbeY [Anaerolineales bacterium]